MSLDAFTLSAISVVVVLAVLLAVVTFMASRSQHSRIEALERASRSSEAPTQPVPESRAQRELCGAIHRLYPNARVGLDFQVKKEGGALAIAEWLLPTPAPTAEELASAIAEYREEQQNQAYREAREAEYPSVGDQLDALYKARQGDPSDLAAIDARIAQVKARHPKPGQC